ncbi:MAG: DUF4115 domain-containing protein [Desulfovibrio sp.]|jgi:cytoskeleton protein RodZ|nr:DUF4115 domain-containing protein [Desulfovibrio sp.]
MTLEELGATLRVERERRSLSVDDVSEILKINARLLRALEEGDVAALPHPTYVRGFVRSYAAFLGFAAEEVNAAVIPGAASDMTTTPSNISVPEPPRPVRKKSGIPLIVPFVLLIVLAGALIAAWQPLSTMFHRTPQRLAVPAAPADSAREAALSLPSTPHPSGTETRKHPAQAPSDDVAGTELPGASAQKTSPPLQDTAPGAATDARQGVNDGPRPSTHNVIITATEECWIHSRADGTDTRQFSLRKGDTFALAFQKRLDLKLGNAGGVRIRYNGQDMPAAGQSGQVRTLVFPPQPE